MGEVELLAAALLNSDNVTDVIEVVLRLDKGIEHVDKDRALLLSRARASLLVTRVMNAKPFLKRWINMILEDACQINWVFLQIIEGSDRVEKGAVVHLSAQLDRIAFGA
jgi:hypothetical protein